MLVLTRKCQEKIQIGDNITITIVRVKGQSVRVGIDAPRELKVKRSELAPEAPAPEACTASATPAKTSTTPACSASKAPASKESGSETCDSEPDCRSNFRGAKQPLKQFVPRNRLVSITCSAS